MSGEVWTQVYDRLATLILEHRTTLLFVNTRRMVERLARHLSERVGEENVAAHHGSLSKERRLNAEQRLKRGGLKVLVATASLAISSVFSRPVRKAAASRSWRIPSITNTRLMMRSLE